MLAASTSAATAPRLRVRTIIWKIRTSDTHGNETVSPGIASGGSFDCASNSNRVVRVAINIKYRNPRSVAVGTPLTSSFTLNGPPPVFTIHSRWMRADRNPRLFQTWFTQAGQGSYFPDGTWLFRLWLGTTDAVRSTIYVSGCDSGVSPFGS
jgi:hypothetical protein